MMNAPRLRLLPNGLEAEGSMRFPHSDSALASEVHSELQRLFSSSQFDASARNRRFLEYVIEETLAGRAERIKAYNIATTVFGRDDNFDPQLDPVVRMEARRLRRSLEKFYLAEGARGPVQIAMPKGGYVPQFANKPPQKFPAPIVTPSAHFSVCPSCGPSIFVAPFEVEGDDQCHVRYSHGLVRQIAIGLNRFPEISVFMSVSLPAQTPGGAADPTQVTADVDFVLTGNAAVAPDKLTATVTLVNARSGCVIWGGTFDQGSDVSGLLDARDRIAERIVRALFERYSATPSDGS